MARINHSLPGTEKRSKVKTTMRKGFTSAGMAKLNTIDNTKCWRGEKQLELSDTADGCVKWSGRFGKQFGNFL